ncbi:MAG: efflux RND transporter periplasmic adaptor subunit [Gammaproteobacteria bacterium]|nr:efflux RND transporter periplasmic adaptor subunit [Gammaproteobacteria bacterium]
MPTLLFCSLATAEPIPVTSQPFSELAIYPSLSAPAEVVSDNLSRISAEISARIVSIPVRVGDTVKKGAVLARLEREDFVLALKREQATLQAIDAKLDLAHYELKRARSLSKQQAVSEQLLKQREATVNGLLAEQQAQQTAITQAKRQLDKTELRAPFTAVILERIGAIGELASPGSPLLRIIDMDTLEVAVKLSASQAKVLGRTRSTDDTPDNNPAIATPEFISAGQHYPVTLRRITPALDTRARTQEARLRFTGKLPLPGVTGELRWSRSKPSLPAEFISQRADRLGVFVWEKNQARFVTLNHAETGRPVVLTLPLGTAIITDGRYRLRDGDAVTSGVSHVSSPSPTR